MRRDRVRRLLLHWYDSHRRTLPWRAVNEKPDPYRVWLSEVMLQQTTTGAVAPYYAKFLALFPTIDALANAPRDVVLEAWAGLGYYSRARNLHAAAGLLAANGFPPDEAGWRGLPGVGAYTAAAIAAIAYDEPTNVVDGNVERVMARLHAVETTLPQAKPELREHAAALVAPERAGDWAQALMDLGATICTPKSPRCLLCPLREDCAAFASGAPETFPRRAAKTKRPERRGVAFRLERPGWTWLVRRPDNGLLGGMAALPTTPWREEAWREGDAIKHAPANTKWTPIGSVRHVFTHFGLTLDVWRGEGDPTGEGWWAAHTDFRALPTVFRKAAQVQGEEQ
ncbi:MAG TPA: A/G-specific adenine glycosylase [Caulobacterales bacterium]|nr:A/G-specific adenine glycosylase [Caulobacterales bacterium]